jgi:superfamily II RNA helicase
MSYPDVEVLNGPSKGLDEYILKSPFEYDDFQKHSFVSIEKGNDVFVSVPTSGGKTIVAEYAICHTIKRKHKRVVYTSPIKSLSNEKYNDFKNKFDFGVGIITGDNKINMDSECIIATAEILKNSLYNLKQTDKGYMEMGQDFIDSIGCVVLDEIHFMNDENRGKVWEEIITLLNPNVQLIMLSATVKNPNNFASWISSCRNTTVSLITVDKRIIPLTHKLFVDDELYQFLDGNNEFSVDNFNLAKNNHKILQKNRKLQVDYNCVQYLVEYLNKNNLLQAIFFSFSRHNCEMYAKSITSNLINHVERTVINDIFDSQMISHIHKYKHASQINTVKKLLNKGIAYHHSGLLPILKEIIEIIFKKGLIKVLFATETFAVGVNTPTRTVVFTETIKHDRKGKRNITTVEYKQMSGRAGRRGIDDVGLCIILPLFEFPDELDLKNIVSGNISEISSKFKWDYQFYLKMLQSSTININQFFDKSLINVKNKETLCFLKSEYTKLLEINNVYEDKIKECGDKIDPINKLIKYEKQSQEYNIHIKLTNKQIKEKKKCETLINKNEHLKNIYDAVKEKNNNDRQLIHFKRQITSYEKYVSDYCDVLNNILIGFKYIVKINDKYNVTLRGIIASQINECNSILLTEMLMTDLFFEMKIEEIIQLLSIFTDPINSKEKISVSFENTILLENGLSSVNKIIHKFNDIEVIESGSMNEFANWKISTDYINICRKWVHGNSVTQLLSELNEYEGNFVKNMVKIHNIICDMKCLCKILGKITLITELDKSENLIIRDIVSINSLYLS